MQKLEIENIREVADSAIIYARGEFLQKNGAYSCRAGDDEGHFSYGIEGNYGTYTVEVRLGDELFTRCNCPYPGEGCKHVVAVLLDLFDRQPASHEPLRTDHTQSAYLTAAEIREQALEDRIKRGKREIFELTQGDMLKGDHLLGTSRGRQYQLTLHDPEAGLGHCSCPDFHYNKLSTCKHLVFLSEHLRQQQGFSNRLKREIFPYIDIYWDSAADNIRLYLERLPESLDQQLQMLLGELFDVNNLFNKEQLSDFIPFIDRLLEHKMVRIQESVLDKLAVVSADEELALVAAQSSTESPHGLKITPYPYQQQGIDFGLYKKAVLIGDEMGLGKTLQAISLGILKKEIFGFSKVLVVTLSSLKEQWQREIARFSNEKGSIIAGSAKQRKQQYRDDDSLFRITNYEAVLRDVTILTNFRPDLIILDEAQRIKNFETKTAEAVKSIPRQHAIILTGTPLENKLEDVYSLVQFLDPELLSPLWQFAADHFLLNPAKKNDILGYTNLHLLREKLRPMVIRRRKEDVLDELPELIINDYFVDLYQEQQEIHAGYSSSLLPLLNKKFLTPMDLRRIQMLLLKMRQVCDTTYLIDRETNISPKLDELATILDELVLENNRKVVIFSEWTTMTMLIGKHLSRAGIPFVELSGQVPIKKRQALIDEFTTNPDCKVFLSTDAGGTGLNLQAADCVVNFELPWNPAKLNQRIGRVNRIGQQSNCINVVNLIAKNSIEERIMAGIQLKLELFDGVFEDGQQEVLLSRKRRQEMVDQLREMIGEEVMGLDSESAQPEILPEETPHYLNPEVLAREVDYIGEEISAEPVVEVENDDKQQPAEQMEEVLNQGMGFISGLLEMATGEKLSVKEDGSKMVSIDKATGEVTLTFTLPGFK
jgi:superfamily II DNA or RNA helicase